MLWGRKGSAFGVLKCPVCDMKTEVIGQYLAFDYPMLGGSNFWVCGLIKSLSVTIQMRVSEQYFIVVGC